MCVRYFVVYSMKDSASASGVVAASCALSCAEMAIGLLARPASGGRSQVTAQAKLQHTRSYSASEVTAQKHLKSYLKRPYTPYQLPKAH